MPINEEDKKGALYAAAGIGALILLGRHQSPSSSSVTTPSSSAGGTTPSSSAALPAQVTITKVQTFGGGTTASVFWSPGKQSPSVLTGYQVTLEDTSGTVIRTFTVAQSSTAPNDYSQNGYPIGGLTPSTSYQVTVTATGPGGPAAPSAAVSFTTQAAYTQVSGVQVSNVGAHGATITWQRNAAALQGLGGSYAGQYAYRVNVFVLSGSLQAYMPANGPDGEPYTINGQPVTSSNGQGLSVVVVGEQAVLGNLYDHATYQVVVTPYSVAGVGQGLQSEAVNFTTSPPPPTTPVLSIAGLNITPTQPSYGQKVSLAFQLVNAGSSGAYTVSAEVVDAAGNAILTTNTAAGTIASGGHPSITLTTTTGVPYWESTDLTSYPHTARVMLTVNGQTKQVGMVQLPTKPQPQVLPAKIDLAGLNVQQVMNGQGAYAHAWTDVRLAMTLRNDGGTTGSATLTITTQQRLWVNGTPGAWQTVNARDASVGTPPLNPGQTLSFTIVENYQPALAQYAPAGGLGESPYGLAPGQTGQYETRWTVSSSNGDSQTINSKGPLETGVAIG